MSDLVAFLAARLAEDEAEARENINMGWQTPRALREVEAKRAHLDQYRMAVDAARLASMDENNSLNGYRDATWGACLADAAVYSDHPDYNPAWRPG